ncbi:hypothetical protein K1719_001723 [Acacia pycnantha]|nr:hypothetical protein K1719_001723 [Acacia pycnantha]
MEQTVINVAAPYLPKEIITNILKRLPVKSLLRFRCVCKPWKNLFKTPSFIQEHLSHSKNQDPSLLMVADNSNDGFFLFLFNCKMQFREIVRLSRIYSDISEAKVYSLSTGSWRNIQFDKINVSISSHSVTVNGVTFWHGSDNYIMGTQDCRHVIVSFDLATEMFNVIPWPGLVSFLGPSFVSYSANLAVYDDELGIISHHKTRNSQYSSFYLEVMEEGTIGSLEQRWSSSKKFINNSNLELCVGTIWRNQIVCTGRRTYSECGIMNKEHLYLIDVFANGCKRFDIPKPTSGVGVKVFNYVESLVPVSGNIQIEET